MIKNQRKKKFIIKFDESIILTNIFNGIRKLNKSFEKTSQKLKQVNAKKWKKLNDKTNFFRRFQKVEYFYVSKSVLDSKFWKTINFDIKIFSFFVVVFFHRDRCFVYAHLLFFNRFFFSFSFSFLSFLYFFLFSSTLI